MLLGLLVDGASAAQVEMGKNPIRKVVTLMQNMQKEIEAEGEKEKELYEKFMCFCKTSFADLTKKDADAAAMIDELSAKLKAEAAEKTQIAQELVDHKKDREAAKADLEEATSLRAKEAAEFSATKGDMDTNIAAMASAIPALEKGMGGAVLLQTPAFRRIHQLVTTSPNMDAMDQRDVLAFLDGSSSDQSGENEGGTGQIIGILKQMKEEFEGNLAGLIKDEEAAKAGFAELKGSKEKEVEVATESIETKMARSGELAVSVVTTKNGLEDSTEEQADAVKTLDAVKQQCAAKEKEYSTSQKDRADEMAALGQAIGVLNDDDALDTFKKAVPSFTQVEWTGFLQRAVTRASAPQKANAILEGIASNHHSLNMDLMLFTMRSKLKSHGGVQKFEEIKKMIDDMVVLLGKQQDEDDKTKEFCREEFDKADDEQKAAKTKVASTQASLEEMTDAVATLVDEIKALEDEIIVVDKSVADATVQRKEDHAAYIGVIQMNEAAIALIEKAKGKLEKFYKPAAASAASFIQVRMHTSESDEFGFEEDQQSSTNEAQEQQMRATQKLRNVMNLMDTIINDTKMAQKDAEYAEKTAQDDYADLMAESQESRAASAKALTDKTAAKAELEEKLVVGKETNTANYKELAAVGKLISDLHGSCDFIIENFEARKEARTTEIDSLKNAKAVLSGATF